jgi:hypothetical protein
MNRLIRALYEVTGTLNWVDSYSSSSMTGSEIATLGELSAILFYGGMGGMGDPTEAYIIYGGGYQGPLIYKIEDDNLDTAKAKKELEKRLKEFNDILKDWSVTYKGDGNSSCLSKVVEDKKLIIPFNRRSTKVHAYWVAKDTDNFIWNVTTEVYGSKGFENLGEALLKADDIPQSKTSNKSSFYNV